VRDARACIPSHLPGDPSRDYLRPTNVDEGAPSWKPAFSCIVGREKLCLRVICPFPLASTSGGFTFRFLLDEDTEERASVRERYREREKERERERDLGSSFSGNFHSITGEHVEKWMRHQRVLFCMSR